MSDGNPIVDIAMALEDADYVVAIVVKGDQHRLHSTVRMSHAYWLLQNASHSLMGQALPAQIDMERMMELQVKDE